MATAPMNPAMAAPQGEQEAAPEAAGFTICINVAADGSMNVATEPYEAEEGTAGMPAASLDEAMQIAQQIIDNKGQMPQGNGMTPEDAFAEGFKGTEVA